jgi:hypothetical protein
VPTPSTPQYSGPVQGNPPGWDPAWDDASYVYAGDTYDLTFTIVPSSTSARDVTFELDPSLRDYVTVPGKENLPKGDSVVSLTYTVKRMDPSKEGYVAGDLEATVDGVTGSLNMNKNYLNPLVLGQNLQIRYIPAAPFFEPQLNMTIQNGTKRLYRYSLDGGVTYSDATSEDTIQIKVSVHSEFLILKESNSHSYIIYYFPSGTGESEANAIAREVTLPRVAGLTTNPPAGRHYAKSATDFTFTVFPDAPLADGDLLEVKTDRTLPAGETDTEVTPNDDGTYTATVKRVVSRLSISIRIVKAGDDVTGNGAGLNGSSVWSYGGVLYIASTGNGVASVYNFAGRLVKTVPFAAGRTVSADLPAGLYVVVVNGKTCKVLIKN